MIPQGSCFLRLTPPLPAVILTHQQGQHCLESDPRLTTTLLATQQSRRGGLGLGQSVSCCSGTSPAAPQGPGTQVLHSVCLRPQPSLVLYEHLHLVDKVSGDPQYLLGVVTLSPFVEELDDVSEIHVVVADDLSVGLHQGQGDEQDKVL